MEVGTARARTGRAGQGPPPQPGNCGKSRSSHEKGSCGLDSRNPAMGAARRGSVRPGAQGGTRMAPVHVSAGEIVRFRTKMPAAAEPGGQRVDSPRRGRRPHHPRDAADVEAPARKRIKCGPADIAIGEAAPVSRCPFPLKEAPAGARGLGRLSMGANVRKGKAPPAGSRGGARQGSKPMGAGDSDAGQRRRVDRVPQRRRAHGKQLETA